MASPPRQPDVCPTPTTAATDPCSPWRLMRTLTALVTEQDSKLLATRQGVVNVEEEEEVLAVVTVANTARHSAALGVAGCVVAVVPTTAPAVAVLPLPTKQRGRHLRRYAREHASRPTAVHVTTKQQPVARLSSDRFFFPFFFHACCPDPTAPDVWIRAAGFPTVCCDTKSAHVCVQTSFEC